MEERKALGKGLSSLIPMGNRGGNDSGNKVYFEISPQDIIPNQNQPRKLFDKSAIDELAASIEEKGIIQPLIVRKLGGGKYELIAGERRFRAAQQVKLEKIPVVVKDIDDNEVLEVALIENIQREDLNPVEEALAYRELIGKYQYTQEELAKRLGKDRSNLANTMRLLKLPEEIRAKIISGQLSMGHARAMLAIENRELQIKVADEIIKNDLSVREIEGWIRELKEKDEAPDNQQSEKKLSVKTDKFQIFKDLEEELKKSLKTQVEIRGAANKGKLIIHYHSPEELNRFYSLLASVSSGTA
jgi:ParB family chromosome partitioning protein